MNHPACIHLYIINHWDSKNLVRERSLFMAGRSGEKGGRKISVQAVRGAKFQCTALNRGGVQSHLVVTRKHPKNIMEYL